jgi:hypothetical protein
MFGMPRNASRRKISVSMRVLIQRINWKLKQDNKVLKTARGPLARHQLGEFYIFDANGNCIIDTHIHPVEFARGLGIIEDWEEVRGVR